MEIQRETWRAARHEHQRIVDAWTAPRLARRPRREKHPVDDFLFDYYPISPGKLRTWHPGHNARLESLAGDVKSFPSDIYERVNDFIVVRATWLAAAASDIEATVALLRATTYNTPRTGCFGLHEWAMVLGSDDLRHSQYPLRVSQDEIRATISDVGLRCTHFDAFRFFTDEARPLNPLQLTRATQQKHDQPACLHANMDLYKHAHALAPIVGSEIVRQCFALARDIRDVDMRAAPYDLSELGVEPIAIETPDGRAQFTEMQTQFAQRAHALREALISLTVSRAAPG